jgi:hypothetical protein
MKLGKQLALVSLALASVTPASAQFRSGALSPSLRLLSMPEVRKELKVTDAQTSQLTGLQSGVKGEMLKLFRSFKNVPVQDRTSKFASFRANLDRKLVLILDAGQRKRLRELELQQEGPRVLLKPDVGAELHLTNAQQTKLSTARRKEAESLRELYKGIGAGITPAQQAELRGKVSLIQQKTNSDLYDVLTDAQKSQFKSMLGTPFKFPETKTPAVTISTNSAAKPGAKK